MALPEIGAMKSSNPLSPILTIGALRELSDPRSFDRGTEYFEGGQVEDLADANDGLRASVLGNYLYAVRLWAEGKRLRHSFTCPVGDEGDFCKHCVAAGLAWLDQRPGKGRHSGRRDEPNVPMDDVRALLSRRGKADLVDLVMQHADKDAAFG